jgi:hypothetical protein
MDMAESMQSDPDALVLRLAEHLYEVEGFWPKILDRETPVWIEAALAAEHTGDCTKQPWSCMRCHAEEQIGIAAEVVRRIGIATQTQRVRLLAPPANEE